MSLWWRRRVDPALGLHAVDRRGIRHLRRLIQAGRVWLRVHRGTIGMRGRVTDISRAMLEIMAGLLRTIRATQKTIHRLIDNIRQPARMISRITDMLVRRRGIARPPTRRTIPHAIGRIRLVMVMILRIIGNIHLTAGTIQRVIRRMRLAMVMIHLVIGGIRLTIRTIPGMIETIIRTQWMIPSLTATTIPSLAEIIPRMRGTILGLTETIRHTFGTTPNITENIRRTHGTILLVATSTRRHPPRTLTSPASGAGRTGSRRIRRRLTMSPQIKERRICRPTNGAARTGRRHVPLLGSQ